MKKTCTLLNITYRYTLNYLFSVLIFRISHMLDIAYVQFMFNWNDIFFFQGFLLLAIFLYVLSGHTWFSTSASRASSSLLIHNTLVLSPHLFYFNLFYLTKDSPFSILNSFPIVDSFVCFFYLRDREAWNVKERCLICDQNKIHA